MLDIGAATPGELYSTEYTNTGLLFETRPVFEARLLFEEIR